ncbi:hypothetical protein QL285_038141 [Trifolium repens]|nr:hypothetical protein QL285_038141 [Trifolium repens]
MEYRGWICDPTKESQEYIRGVNEFLDFAFRNSVENGKIWCPCIKCANCKPHYRSSVYDHLTDKNRGFLRDYTQWIFHGEKSTTSSGTMEKQSEMGHDMGGLIRDVFAMPPSEEIFSGEGERNPEVGENVKFYKLVKENEQEKLNKYDNETGTSQSVEEIQSDMPWKDDIYSKVKGTEKRDAVLANVLSLIQNRFVGEDVNEILRAARQVTNASNAPDQTDSPSSYTDED